METAGPGTRASTLRQGGHKHTRDNEGNNLLRLLETAGSC